MMLAAERGAATNTLLAYRRDLEGAEEIIGDLVRADQAAYASLGAAWAGLAPSSLARTVQQFEQRQQADRGAVALTRFSLGAFKQRRHLAVSEQSRQRAARARPRQRGRRIIAAPAFIAHEPAKLPQR